MAMNKEEVWAKNQTLSEKDMEIDTGGSMIVCECVCGGGGGITSLCEFMTIYLWL